MSRPAKANDYRVSRVVILCKDCGQDVGLYPARHHCGRPNNSDDESDDGKAPADAQQDNSWGALWGRLISTTPATTAPAAAEPDEKNVAGEGQFWGMWSKLKDATVETFQPKESDPDEVNNALRAYYKEKGGEVPEFLKQKAEKRVQDDDLDRLASKMSMEDPDNRRQHERSRQNDSGRRHEHSERRPQYPPPRSTPSRSTGATSNELLSRREPGGDRSADSSIRHRAHPSRDERMDDSRRHNGSSKPSSREPDSGYSSPVSRRRVDGHSENHINAPPERSRMEHPTREHSTRERPSREAYNNASKGVRGESERHYRNPLREQSSPLRPERSTRRDYDDRRIPPTSSSTRNDSRYEHPSRSVRSDQTRQDPSSMSSRPRRGADVAPTQKMSRSVQDESYRSRPPPPMGNMGSIRYGRDDSMSRQREREVPERNARQR